MAKNICVIGTGYVGLLTAAGLADFGNQVIGVDIDKEKIDTLNEGKSIIYEPGIEEYLAKNIKAGRLRFTMDLQSALSNSEVVFIAVGTPSLENGDADLHYLYDVVDSIISYIKGYKVIVIKSTVPVGTNREIHNRILTQTSAPIDIVSNPEFLREGKAVYDFFHPERVVIGCHSSEAKEIMEDVYRALNRANIPFVWCNWETAELIKYASNAFLAIKIGFTNQIASLCEEVGADVRIVSKAMGMDGRIGPKFLHAGPGYGGSCFPKDTRALASIGGKIGVPITIVEAVIKANENQKKRVIERLKKHLGVLQGRRIGILGLAFKAETDDIRESPAIDIVRMLLSSGATIQAHDPQAMDNFALLFPTIKYVDSEYDVAKDCDALLILTEWNEYRSLDLEKIKACMKQPYVFDTRNIIDEDELKSFGFLYDFIGR
jgi:UDPglucose 6-dehydrogenase